MDFDSFVGHDESPKDDHIEQLRLLFILDISTSKNDIPTSEKVIKHSSFPHVKNINCIHL